MVPPKAMAVPHKNVTINDAFRLDSVFLPVSSFSPPAVVAVFLIQHIHETISTRDSASFI
ncbi:MAG: hypothetical protein JXA41_11660 [Deltaproteobacteria bacterium]|nr:hypothetical protein [Deltaproteobacteria bacterium]